MPFGRTRGAPRTLIVGSWIARVKVEFDYNDPAQKASNKVAPRPLGAALSLQTRPGPASYAKASEAHLLSLALRSLGEAGRCRCYPRPAFSTPSQSRWSRISRSAARVWKVAIPSSTTRRGPTSSSGTRRQQASRRINFHPWLRSGPPSRAFPPPGMDNLRPSYQPQPIIQRELRGGSKIRTRSPGWYILIRQGGALNRSVTAPRSAKTRPPKSRATLTN